MMPGDRGFVFNFSNWLLQVHGTDAPSWAIGYMVTAVQRGDVQGVSDMRRVLAGVMEMTRERLPEEPLN